jgi:hypothetical protein
MKLRIILIVIVVLIVVGFVLFFVLTHNAGNVGSNVLPGISSTSGGQLPSVAVVYPDAPTGQTISLGTANGTVRVDNFYAASSTQVGEDGTLIIKQTSDYWFSYDPSDSSFWIAISGTPFAAVQQAAEQDFLTTLGVSKADACKLDVSVGVPYSAGNPLDGQSLPLSFCG